MNELLTAIPPKVRKYVYITLAVAGLVYGAYQAANGDWKVAIGSLVTTLLGTLAQANVKPEDSPPEN